MDIKAIYKNTTVEIATPYNVGMGFISSAHNLIITNEHIVSGNQEVVVTYNKEQKQITKVIYTDAVYDIAFLAFSSLAQN